MTSIGLSVALADDDAPARDLYAKLGYAFAHGPFITSTDLFDDDGRPIHVGAVMSYLTKPLLRLVGHDARGVSSNSCCAASRTARASSS